MNSWIFVVSSSLSSSFVFFFNIIRSFVFKMLTWQACCEWIFELTIFWICVQTNLNWKKKMMWNDWFMLDLREKVFMMTILTMMSLMMSASVESLINKTYRTNRRFDKNVENCSSTFLFFTCLSIWARSSLSEKSSIVIVFFIVKISCTLNVSEMMTR